MRDLSLVKWFGGFSNRDPGCEHDELITFHMSSRTWYGCRISIVYESNLYKYYRRLYYIYIYVYAVDLKVLFQDPATQSGDSGEHGSEGHHCGRFQGVFKRGSCEKNGGLATGLTHG
jgi:hypothetical protein